MNEDLYVLGRPHRREKRPRPERLTTLAKALIACGTLFLLLSQGGAIIASPFLVPALWWAYRSSRRLGRVGLAFLAGLVTAEVAWLFAYGTSGEAQPLIYVAPAVGFAGAVIFFWLSGPAAPPKKRDRMISGTWSDVGVGAVLAFLLAASMSAASLGLGFGYDYPIRPLQAALFAVGSAAAWSGFWAWRRKRWLVAAGSFFLSLIWPAGFYVVLTGPISIAFFLVSLARAWRERPANRKAPVFLDRAP